MSHYTLGAHQAHVSQQYISNLLVMNIITPHYRKTITGRFWATVSACTLHTACKKNKRNPLWSMLCAAIGAIHV